MSSDSRSHLNRSAQRRFFRGLVVAVVLLVTLAVPLIVNPQLRLDLAHRFELAPGEDIEQIAGPDEGVALIVAPIEIERERNLPQYRFRAVYLSRETSEGVELTAIDSGAAQSIPLDSLDFIAASRDASHLLLRDTEGSDTGAVLIEVATGVVTPLASVGSVPEIPGNWDEPVWTTTIGECDGFSPDAQYIACFQNPKLASYLAGDWELQVRVYGDADRVAALYRGMGFRPYVGWSGDDRWLYFQNERGIWRVEVRSDMFPSDN